MVYLYVYVVRNVSEKKKKLQVIRNAHHICLIAICTYHCINLHLFNESDLYDLWLKQRNKYVYAGNITGNGTEWLTDFSDIESKFALRTAEVPDDDLCYIEPGNLDSIIECEFNPEAKTFIVIHGWTVNGTFTN